LKYCVSRHHFLLLTYAGLSLYTIVSTTGLFPSDLDYLPLWRYFLRIILVQRVIPYFPKLDWSDILAGRSGGSSGGSEGTGGVNGCGRIGEAEWSIVVVLCDCIEELLGQDKLPHNSAERLATMWGHNSARMGFFHLVYRFVVIEGPDMHPEEARELRKQVAMFQRKASSSDDVRHAVGCGCNIGSGILYCWLIIMRTGWLCRCW
jgi:hypothetical protein